MRKVGLAVCLAICGCADAFHYEPDAPVCTPTREVERVVFVTIDGVRHQEIFGGVESARAMSSGVASRDIVDAPELIPNMYWLARTRGAMLGAHDSAPVVASGPNYVSLPGYFELFTGRKAMECENNRCERVSVETIAERVVGEDVAGSAIISSWPTIAKAAAKDGQAVFVSAGRRTVNHPNVLQIDDQLVSLHDSGRASSQLPGYDNYRPDEHTAALALRYLDVYRPKFLFVGLGDTDEYAHRDDYPGYLALLRHADDVVGRIAVALESMREPYLLIVATDHGRSDDFTDHGAAWQESARVWLLAAGDPVRARGLISGPPRTLADIAPTAEWAMGLAADASEDRGEVLTELLSSVECGQ